MATVVVIGRGLGDEYAQLETVRWADFRYELVRSARNAMGEDVQVYFAGSGEGWSEEWGEEDAFTLIFRDLEPDEREQLEGDLAILADFFEQEAIAVMYGPTVFVP